MWLTEDEMESTSSRKRIVWLLFVWCLFFFPLSSAPRQPLVTPAPKRPAPARSSKTEVLIAAVGDIMMPSSIQAFAAKTKSGYDILFQQIAVDLSGADVIIANLETPVDHTAKTAGYPRFNAHPRLLKALKKAGVTVVSLANNHAIDAGPGGLKRTIDNVESAGLVFIGAGRTRAEAADIKFLKIRDLSLALLSYTYGTNGCLSKKRRQSPWVNIVKSDTDFMMAKTRVQQARQYADIVVVSMHWGEEYVIKPTQWQRRVAGELIDAGADLVLGHHPHVLQPIESHPAQDGRVGLVAFSLGNFISSQNAGVTTANKNGRKALRGDGIILNITAVKEGGKARIDRAEFLPIWTLRRFSGRGLLYRPVSIAREIERLKSKGSRNREEEDTLSLLAFRYDVITNMLMAGQDTR